MPRENNPGTTCPTCGDPTPLSECWRCDYATKIIATGNLDGRLRILTPAGKRAVIDRVALKIGLAELDERQVRTYLASVRMGAPESARQVLVDCFNGGYTVEQVAPILSVFQ